MPRSLDSRVLAEDPVPPKIDAAMHYLYFATRITQPSSKSFGSEKPESRDLSPLENLVYESALTTLVEYFNMPGFGEPKPPTDRATGEVNPLYGI